MAFSFLRLPAMVCISIWRALHDTVDRRLTLLITIGRAANPSDEALSYSLRSRGKGQGRCALRTGLWRSHLL